VNISFQEKRAIVSLFSTAFVFALYISYLISASRAHYSPTDFSFWGVAILFIVPITVIIKIIVHVIFVFINRTVAKEKEVLLTDELDKLIELKATKYSHWIFMLGFFLSMIPIMMNMRTSNMFLSMVITAFVSGMTRDITQIYLYRKGF
jgi:hypothetical protein